MSTSNFAAQIANRTITSARVCEYCGMVHDFLGKICGNQDCGSCYQYCLRSEGCTWKNQPTAIPPSVAKIDHKFATPSNLKEAFCSWLVSTDLVETKPDTEVAFAEFELYFKESLDPVDINKTYFRIVVGDDSKGSFEVLDVNKLHRSQDGCYVIIEGNKRTRIGKNVAVMS